ncbi:hypothetical protein AAFF_G00066080 [Aldrovandia affinis]|uniref:Uncharacterized protein n=1 Tax=Aldrovandia affinis TaxID=143900 RepID=A0AAD7T4F3_9TELE|nr:hypothetical protein AAFF_G00066080 [Aldrovandia affinis]
MWQAVTMGELGVRRGLCCWKLIADPTALLKISPFRVKCFSTALSCFEPATLTSQAPALCHSYSSAFEVIQG